MSFVVPPKSSQKTDVSWARARFISKLFMEAHGCALEIRAKGESWNQTKSENGDDNYSHP